VTARLERIAVIGGGPIGLEAALLAQRAGFNVQLYERGRIAENVLSWGHVKLFSPFSMNASPWGREALAGAESKHELPVDDELLSGREFVERYLLPLSRLSELTGRIHESVEVLAVGRSRTWKGELIGRPERGNDPFQLLLRDANGERTAQADWLFDCSGTYPNHNWVGAGGVPCVGETSALVKKDYRLPDILGKDRGRFAGNKTLVVGSGYSAATAVVALAELAKAEPQTQIVWITRSNRTPSNSSIENDPLAERKRLREEVNRLVSSNNGPVQWRPSRLIRQIETDSAVPKSRFTIWTERFDRSTEASNPAVHSEQLCVERIIANVGYRPDRQLYEELQVHECYASQGPMKLAAALLGETSSDCLSQSSHVAETLRNPEPGLFIIGSKSYGRDSRFLIRIGLEQISDVFSLIGVPAATVGQHR